MNTDINYKIALIKNQRVAIDSLIQAIKVTKESPEETLAWRALQQAKHWLGEALAELGNSNPYPNSMNPSNAIVDPTADTAKS